MSSLTFSCDFKPFQRFLQIFPFTSKGETRTETLSSQPVAFRTQFLPLNHFQSLSNSAGQRRDKLQTLIYPKSPKKSALQRSTAGKGFKSPLENGAQMARHADDRPQLDRIQTITVLVAWIPVTKSPAQGMPLDDRSLIGSFGTMWVLFLFNFFSNFFLFLLYFYSIFIFILGCDQPFW